MNIWILTGLGEIAKRQHLIELKQQFNETVITEFDLHTYDASTVKESIIQSSLFSDSRLVILENPPTTLNLAEFSLPDHVSLVILTSHLPISSKLFTSAKMVKARLIDFVLEKELSAFPFIDALIEKKVTAFVELNKLLEQYGSMYVLSMIYYLLRRNILPLPKFPIVQKKIKYQKAKYNDKTWINFYELTLETEYRIKSGLIDEKLALARLVQAFLSTEARDDFI